MPSPGHCWWHVVLNTFGSWYTGDPRGFRSRNHRKHSDGDYKQPPPVGQHSGLHRHVKAISRPPLHLPRDLYEPIGCALLDKIDEQGYRALVLSVDEHHVHLLIELPEDRQAVKYMAGRWKQHASHAVRGRLPGTIWSKSCDPVRVRDEEHHRNVFRYILDHGQQGAWVWRFDR